MIRGVDCSRALEITLNQASIASLNAEFLTEVYTMNLETVSRHLRAIAGVFALFSLVPGLLHAASGVTAYEVSQIAPSGATYTYVSALNKTKTVVGEFTAANGATEGFQLKKGVYTTLVFPGSSSFTRANGINDAGLIVGDFYLSSDNAFHGFKYSKGKYTQYDYDLGVVSTSLFGVNNAGDFVGSIGANGQPNQGFINIGGNITLFYGSGSDSTFVYAINNSNDVAGTYYDSSNNAHGFYRSSTGTITLINFPGSLQTNCSGLNDSGVVTGYYTDSTGLPHGFLYSAGTYTSQSFYANTGINAAGDLVGVYAGPGPSGVVEYGLLALPKTFASYASIKITGAQSSAVYAINNTKAMVGVYTNSSGATHGLLYAKSKVTNIDDPNAQAGSTAAYGINTASDIVGSYTNGGNITVGFYYTGGTYTDIAPSGSFYTNPTGINDSGVIAGAWADSGGNEHGFTYNGSTYTTLNVPGAQFTGCWGINDSGQVTCQWGDSAGLIESSIYNGSTYTTINVPGAYLSAAHSINKAGDVVFLWGDPNYNFHGAILSKGAYYIFDVPPSLGAGTDADGINDTNEIVGHFTPTGTSVTQAYDGKL